MNSVHFTKFYSTYKCPCVLFFYIYLKYIEMPTIPSAVQEQLQTPYHLEKEQIDFYQENRFVKLKEVFDEATITFFNEAITDRVNQMNTQSIPLEERSTYGKAFLQLFNLWRQDDVVKELIVSNRLNK
jgi:hypothetical protein